MRHEHAKRFLPVLVVAGVIAIGAAPEDSQAAAGGTDRPISGMCETEVTPKSPPDVVPIVLAVDLTCRLAHLGLTTGGTERQVVIPMGPPNGAGLVPINISIESITYVAANGDKLRSTFAGGGTIDLNSGRVVFNGTETFTGGTGRFKNATGTSMTSGEASQATNRGFLTISGTVSY